jgi:hypothetical protein
MPEGGLPMRMHCKGAMALLIVLLLASTALAAKKYRHTWLGRACGHTHTTISYTPQSGKTGPCPQCNKSQHWTLQSREEIDA